MPVVLALLVFGFLIVPGDAAAQPPEPPSYLDIIKLYAKGDYDAAGEAMLKFPRGKLESRAFDAFERTLVRSLGGGNTDLQKLASEQRVAVADAWAQLVPAAAVLHLEVGIYQLSISGGDEGIDHLSLARELVDWSRWEWIAVERPEVRKTHARFRRDIYVGIAWVLQDLEQFEPLDAHLRRCRELFPNDADVLLASGSYEEAMAQPGILGKRLPAQPRLAEKEFWRETVRKLHLEKAEEYHRAAIARDATLAEAHLRLGRTLSGLQRLPEARQSLEKARDLKPPSDIGYLAALFLARVIEDEGNEEAAFAQYREITLRWPGCQAAHLALSRGYELRGDRQAALGALQPLWRPPKERACPVDPWWIYGLGQAWRLRAHIEALRARVIS